MSQFPDLKSFEISVKAQSLIISMVDFHFFFFATLTGFPF